VPKVIASHGFVRFLVPVSECSLPKYFRIPVVLIDITGTINVVIEVAAGFSLRFMAHPKGCGYQKLARSEVLMNKRLHLYISGRVQGVFFRYSARQRAEELGLTGFARNLNDGRVEIIAEGEESGLQNLLSWANHGPPGAYVDRVENEWSSVKNVFSSFTIR